ncbi:MAG TPA: hypothetical protein VM802_05875, partial [Chitinophaga sp.]|uniref:hypothetical protein n=1 Tax=Chitinophaga sp. TaxID=1869181 RepID=UPI002CB6B9F7
DLDETGSGKIKPVFFETGQQRIHIDSCKVGFLIGTPKIKEPVDITVYRYDVTANVVLRTPVYTFKKVTPGRISEFATLLYNSEEISYVLTVKYSRNGKLFPGMLNNNLFDDDLFLNNMLTICVPFGNGNKSNVASLIKLEEADRYFYTSCITQL